MSLWRATIPTAQRRTTTVVNRWIRFSSSSTTADIDNIISAHMEGTDRTSNVALLWEQTNKNDPLYRTIRLQEQWKMTSPSSSTNGDQIATATAHEVEPEIPDAVLQFERQLRKAQHAKKVGIRPTELNVIYVDEDIVVVNKPSGVLTVPGVNQNGSIADLVHETYGFHPNGEPAVERDQMVGHRLDMDTSGLLVFGRKLSVTRQLHDLFRDKKVSKEYQTVVLGHWPTDICTQGQIDLPLQKDIVHPPFMRVSTPQYRVESLIILEQLQQAGWKKLVKKSHKPSQTEFQVLSSSLSPKHKLPYTKLRLSPLTGRTHQLRVHCAALGYFIVGDPTYSLYGEAHAAGGLGGLGQYVVDPDMTDDSTRVDPLKVSRPSLALQKQWTEHYPPNTKPMCLHAAKLSFYHPTRPDEWMSFEVEPDFDKYLAEL